MMCLREAQWDVHLCLLRDRCDARQPPTFLKDYLMYLNSAWKLMFSIALGLMASGCSSMEPAQPAEPKTIDPKLSCAVPTNCVNSRTSPGLAPLRFTGSATQGLALLKATLASFPEATVLQLSDREITAVFTTPVGFRDNVIFLVDPQQKQIDFQSKSGFGLYDFGKNRSRMEAFSKRFAEVTQASTPK
jgi:uncharacterized protein (DUF1499 family)